MKIPIPRPRLLVTILAFGTASLITRASPAHSARAATDGEATAIRDFLADQFDLLPVQIKDLHWSARTVPDFAKELADGSATPPVKKEGAERWIKKEIAPQLPEKGDGHFPSAARFTDKRGETRPKANQDKEEDEPQTSRKSEKPQISSTDDVDTTAKKLAGAHRSAA